MASNGFRLVSGGTDNHLMLVDVGAGDVTVKIASMLGMRQAGHEQPKKTHSVLVSFPFKAGTALALQR